MKKGKERARRAFVVSGTYALEHRVLLTSIADSLLRPAHAHVGASRYMSQDTIHERHQSGPAARLAGHTSGHPTAAAVFSTAKLWSWLANTYWYVPTSNLPAVLYNSQTGTVTPVSDQTVYHVVSYQNGYFWGDSVTQLGSSSPAPSSMLGSVTPEGKILLTFTQTSGSTSPSITEGYGKMQRKFGQWTMENQMFTSPAETLQIGHWAYMVRTRPGLSSWDSLPSAGVSVPAFLSGA